ncbi:hypothetical protein GIB67_002651 [Kingdonia uniflora]|uniref:Uncharacterized protein n=1 Tax=Kingdonia uniflora TaxID=39325 RepID=A0A7J7LJH8_9MAGN|nr:hypothetical protein GIB67_002651 [Kingdonia uniflora]
MGFKGIILRAFNSSFGNHGVLVRIEVAYQEAIALKRQKELIREEDAAGQAESELKARRGAAKKNSRKNWLIYCGFIFLFSLIANIALLKLFELMVLSMKSPLEY